jgi:hypothetical protein
MTIRTGLMLVATIVLATATGGAFAQTPRPTNSLDGPLPVTMTGDILVNPGPRWPASAGIPAVWVAGTTQPVWQYKFLCLVGQPDNWAQLGEDGRNGWELVSQAGIVCAQGSLNGQWFILKRPGAAAK